MAPAERADARRNREQLLAVATAAFAAAEEPVSLEAIAREAGVGIGTLYRHFPNREALTEAVYRAELAEVSATAGDLLAQYPPTQALRRWMDRYAAFVAAKQGMAESLRAVLATGAIQVSDTRAGIVGAVDQLLTAGVADGTMRAGVKADDVVSALIGVLLASHSAEQTGRLLDLVAAGVAAKATQ
jgi:AcrR family transcriptional regulator